MTTSPIDLSSPEFLANPYPVYAHLREAQAPSWLPHGGSTGGMWLFTRYEDVAEILKEARTSKDLSRLLPPEKLSPIDHAMLSKDPPDHTRLRSLANQAFTPSRVRDLEPRIAHLADDLIRRVQSRGQMDFMADFALPLPVIVIAELLGVPPEDREMFRAWSNQIVTGVDAVRASQEIVQKQEEALMALADYFTDLIRQRREQPREDLISAMIQARDAQDRLSEEELLGTCILLLIAGHETTVNLLGNGLLTLLPHPDQLALLRRRPEEITSAVEEMLRFESPVQRATFRVTTSAIEIGGTTLEKGQQVSAVIGAANRDPAQFPDPDRFDVTRHPNRHLAFGLGIHFCLGAPLARAEARMGFIHLLQKLPTLRLVNEVPDWGPNTFFRGLRSLPLDF